MDISTLGLNLNNSVLLPKELSKWVHEKDDTYRSVSLQSCMEEKGLGYACDSGVLETSHVGLNSKEGKCNYKLQPYGFNSSALVLVDSTCTCIRSWCEEFLVNYHYKIPHNPYVNFCLCSVFSVIGCDINFTRHEIPMQTVYAYYILYNHIEPIHLGVDITALRQLMLHPDLKEHLRQLRKESKEVMVTVHHASSKIQRRIQSNTASPHWLESLFGGSVDFDQVWHILLHPAIVVLFI